MDSLLIYILDSASNPVEKQLDSTVPLSNEQVVDLIISGINGKDEDLFKTFKRKYEKLSFSYYSNDKKIEILQEDLSELEDNYSNKGIWNDPNELKSDLLNDSFSFYTVEGKKVLYLRQFEELIYMAAGWLIITRKKAYLTAALKNLRFLNQGNLNGGLDLVSIELLVNALNKTNGDNQYLKNKRTEKKVSEKWYALLHMILINMRKETPFEKGITKEELMEFGKTTYSLKGTGQCFSTAIRQIGNKALNKYIYSLTKTDFRKWKKTIIELSGNDPEVITWISKNKY
jgi:hypothetical protein